MLLVGLLPFQGDWGNETEKRPFGGIRKTKPKNNLSGE